MPRTPPVAVLVVPTAATLKKYGLSQSEWQAIAERQGCVCAICGKLPTTGRLVIDHHHAKGWRRMPPEQRKTFVRGLLCWFDNYYLVRKGVSPERAHAAGDYLAAHSQLMLPSDSCGRVSRATT